MGHRGTSERPALPTRLLVVDDDTTAGRALAIRLTNDGFDVETAASGDEALEKLPGFAPDLLLTAVRMPGIDGVELLNRARSLDPQLSVVVMTAFGTARDAVRAMQAGAEHYVTTPVDIDALTLVIARVQTHRELVRETALLRERVRAEHRFENLLGTSAAMRSVVKTILQVAPSRATVLLTGESGTGKERVAQALHEASPRATGPFVKIHCASLAETLLASELFGHEKGAFTGAVARREGRFTLAHGGTLFLDEVSEVSPGVQVKLLRVLQDREFARVGGSETLTVDVRVVAATHRDLANLVRDGRFREDLYDRLNGVGIHLPALRARREDIPLLAQHFLTRFAAGAGKPVTGFTPEAMRALTLHNWPGNVREIENTIGRCIALTDGPLVRREHLALPADVPDPTAEGSLGAPPPIPGATLEAIEKYALLATLEACGGSTHRTADTLGGSVRMVQYRLREYRHGVKRITAPAESPPAVSSDAQATDGEDR